MWLVKGECDYKCVLKRDLDFVCYFKSSAFCISSYIYIIGKLYYFNSTKKTKWKKKNYIGEFVFWWNDRKCAILSVYCCLINWLIHFVGEIKCTICHQAIMDRQIYQVHNQYAVHHHCLQCKECGVPLKDACYIRQVTGLQQLFCKQHVKR